MASAAWWTAALCGGTVTVEGDEMRVDWAGSSPQSAHGINLVLNYTHAYASYAMKAAVAPEVPHNDGAFRPVHVTAPLGSILNCEHPAPVASRHVIGHFLPGIIFGALAPASRQGSGPTRCAPSSASTAPPPCRWLPKPASRRP